MAGKRLSSKKYDDSEKVFVRKYTDDFQKQVYSLILSIFEQELINVPVSDYLKDINFISKVYKGERDQFWIATIGSRVVGTIAIKEDSKNEAMMRRFFVSPAHRSQGIAKKLFKKALDFAKKSNYKRLIFVGNSQMYQARKVLLKYGFEEKEEINLGEIQIFKSIFYL